MMGERFSDADFEKLSNAFDGTVYNECINFTIEDWAEAVLRRFYWSGQIQWLKEETVHPKVKDRIRNNLAAFFENPLVARKGKTDFDFCRVLDDMRLDDLFRLYHLFDTSPRGRVERARNDENLKIIYEAMDISVDIDADSYKQELKRTIYSLHQDEDECLDPDFTDPYAVFIQVNLSASDELLKAEFENWLTDKRKERAAKDIDPPMTRHFTIADVMRWTNLRVLGYMDLMLLAEYLEITGLTNNVTGRLLFPEPAEAVVNLAGRVSDSIKPEVKKLQGGEMLPALIAAAAAKMPLRETRR